jgi:hypothetical protein
MTGKMNIRDEEILLLGLCRISFDTELKIMLLALVETVTDWPYFSLLTQKHGVAALIYHNLEKLGFLRFIPAEQAENLHTSLLTSITRNTGLIESAAETMQILNDENIKIVLLKGLALELSVYGNIGLRQMADVDVLATLDDCLEARKVLLEKGFISHPVKSVLHKLIMPYAGKHLPTLTRNGFAIELHHDLFGAGKNVLTKMLYDNSLSIALKSSKTFIPRPQIFFLYLVKHLYLHEINNESQLRLYTDLIVLLERHRDEIINHNLLVYAGKAGMSEILAWRLEPLRDLWGISFPEWLNDFINRWYNPDSINHFVFFLKSPKENPLREKALVYRNTIKDIPGLHRKVIYVLGDLFPTLEFMKKRYRCSGFFKALFHYPLRLGKLWYLVKK